jgi:hypothetical protein
MVTGFIRTSEICLGQNFTDVDTLLFWVGDPWYGNDQVVTNTRMTQTERDNFYDTTLVGSFGYTLA